MRVIFTQIARKGTVFKLNIRFNTLASVVFVNLPYECFNGKRLERNIGEGI